MDTDTRNALKEVAAGKVEQFGITDLENMGIEGLESPAGRLDDDAIMEQAEALLARKTAKPYEAQMEEALNQIHDVASERVYGGTPTDSLKWARAKLERIAQISEAKEPDEDWDPAKFEEAGEISTSDGLGGDPRRDEDNQAALDAAAEAGAMSTSDGLGGEPSRRDKVMTERFRWLADHDLTGAYADYRDGKSLTDLLRERNDDSELVHQLSTWIDEDAAERGTPDAERHAAALRKLRKWIEDPDTDGDDPIDVVVEVLREANVIPTPQRKESDSEALDNLAGLLRGEWPSGGDFGPFVADYVRRTGRNID